MKRLIVFVASLLLVFAVFGLIRTNNVYAGCCGCQTKTDPGGSCDMATSVCDKCDWCDPGQGHCPKPTNKPPPTQPPGTPKPTQPGGGGGGGCVPNGGNCDASPDGCCESCNVNVVPNKCFHDVNQIPNMTKCDTNRSCVPAYGWNCVDCSGGCPIVDGEENCNSCCNNCTAESCLNNPPPATNPPVPTAIPPGRIRGQVFLDDDKNGKKNGTEAFRQNVRMDIIRSGGSCPPPLSNAYKTFESIDTGPYNYSDTVAAYATGYDFSCPIRHNVSYEVRQCSEIHSTSATANTYFVCRAGSNDYRLWKWTTGSTAVRATGDRLPVAGGETYTVNYPLEHVTTLQNWWQVVGGSVVSSQLPEIPVVDYVINPDGKFLLPLPTAIPTGPRTGRGTIYSSSDIYLGEDMTAYPQVIGMTTMPSYTLSYDNLMRTVTRNKSTEMVDQSTMVAHDPQYNPGGTTTCHSVQNYKGQPDRYIIGTGTPIVAGGAGCGNGPFIYFFDKKLDINTNVDLGNKKYVFVVNGDITVDKSVTQLDGIYISDGDFDASEDAVGTSATPNRLTINGMVYSGGSFKMGRTGTPNSFYNFPMYRINYQPQYLLPLIPYLGSPSTSWQEVAP